MLLFVQLISLEIANNEEEEGENQHIIEAKINNN